MALTEIKTSGIADDAITTDKLANAINTERTANTAKVSLGADSVTGAKIADDAIDSEHYTDGSIDTAHIADDAVTADKLANAINTDIAAKAVLTGSTNNQITTVTGANAIQGEAGLTFDGNTMNLTSGSGDARLTLIGTEGNDARISLVADDGDDHIDQYNIRSNADDNSLSIDQFESGSFVERVTVANGGNVLFNVEGTEVDIKSTGSGDQRSLRLLNADATAGNKVGIYFGPANNVAGAGIYGIAESDFTTTANRDGALAFETRHNGNWHERLRIPATGGLTFNGDTASDNALDDYEKGTFTPTIGGWTASGTGTYSGQHGKYIKIGSLVTIWISMSWTNLTSASGILAIEGLPFSANSSDSWGGCCPMMIEHVDLDNNTTVSVIGHQWQASHESILLYGIRDNTSWYGIGIDTSGGINFTSTYPTTA